MDDLEALTDLILELVKDDRQRSEIFTGLLGVCMMDGAYVLSQIKTEMLAIHFLKLREKYPPTVYALLILFKTVIKDPIDSRRIAQTFCDALNLKDDMLSEIFDGKKEVKNEKA